MDNRFSISLKIGQSAEDYIASRFVQPYHTKRCNDSRWDLELYLGEAFLCTIEVKMDLKYHQTGNVAVEYESRGKDSGIKTSKADYWFYVLGEEIWTVRTADLRASLILHNLIHTDGGDDRTSRLILIPLSIFKTIFKLWAKEY